MKFEVYKGTIGYMVTESVSCIPFDSLDSMRIAGYKFRLNGKTVSASEVLKLKHDRLESDMASSVHVNGKVDSDNTKDIRVSTTECDPQVRPARRSVKKVYCKETDRVYSSMSAAGRELGIDPAAISYAVQVNRPTKGYHFEIFEDQGTN